MEKTCIEKSYIKFRYGVLSLGVAWLGAGLNIIGFLLNDGRMPATNTNYLFPDDVKMAFITDIIPYNDGYMDLGLYGYMSIGDILLGLGVVLLLAFMSVSFYRMLKGNVYNGGVRW